MTKQTKDFQYYADKAEVYLTRDNRTQYAEDMALRRAELYVRLAAAALTAKNTRPKTDDPAPPGPVSS